MTETPEERYADLIALCEGVSPMSIRADLMIALFQSLRDMITEQNYEGRRSLNQAMLEQLERRIAALESTAPAPVAVVPVPASLMAALARCRKHILTDGPSIWGDLANEYDVWKAGQHDGT